MSSIHTRIALHEVDRQEGDPSDDMAHTPPVTLDVVHSSRAEDYTNVLFSKMDILVKASMNRRKAKRSIQKRIANLLEGNDFFPNIPDGM